MIVCETQFDYSGESEFDPRYYRHEVDFSTGNLNLCGKDSLTYRLSLRKNIATGEYELYRAYSTYFPSAYIRRYLNDAPSGNKLKWLNCIMTLEDRIEGLFFGNHEDNVCVREKQITILDDSGTQHTLIRAKDAGFRGEAYNEVVFHTKDLDGALKRGAAEYNNFIERSEPMQPDSVCDHKENVAFDCRIRSF